MKYDNKESNIVQENEYGYLTDKHFPSDQEFYINVPKIMPHINRGKPKVTPVGIPKGIFINDGACKPQASSVQSQQNYLLIPRFENKDFEFKINTKKNGADAIDIGTQFFVKFTDANILVFHVADDM